MRNGIIPVDPKLGAPRNSMMAASKKPARHSSAIAFGGCVNDRYGSVGKTFSGADLPGGFF